jgi:hypothetical protein
MWLGLLLTAAAALGHWPLQAKVMKTLVQMIPLEQIASSNKQAEIKWGLGTRSIPQCPGSLCDLMNHCKPAGYKRMSFISWTSKIQQ